MIFMNCFITSANRLLKICNAYGQTIVPIRANKMKVRHGSNNILDVHDNFRRFGMGTIPRHEVITTNGSAPYAEKRGERETERRKTTHAGILPPCQWRYRTGYSLPDRHEQGMDLREFHRRKLSPMGETRKP